MNIFKLIIILLLISLYPEKGSSQSKTITNWAENRDGLRKLCFYPTTLRMVNISHDQSFNKMVKDIDKLKIIISDNKTPINKADLTFLKSGIKSEDYKDMVQIKQGKQSFFVYIKEKNEKPVGFAGIVYSENNFVLIDLEGYISPEIIQQLIEGKINFGAISKLYDITKVGDDNQKQPKKK